MFKFLLKKKFKSEMTRLLDTALGERKYRSKVFQFICYQPFFLGYLSGFIGTWGKHQIKGVTAEELGLLTFQCIDQIFGENSHQNFFAQYTKFQKNHEFISGIEASTSLVHANFGAALSNQHILSFLTPKEVVAVSNTATSKEKIDIIIKMDYVLFRSKIESFIIECMK